MKSTTTLSLFALCSAFTSALPTNKSWATAFSHPREVTDCHFRNCFRKCGDSDVCNMACLSKPQYASCDYKEDGPAAGAVVRAKAAANGTVVVEEKAVAGLEDLGDKKVCMCPLPWGCC
ncbi:hypothetical protein E8E12_000416 [Didymella heteroderae]|uniref:Uncharacterized protein n=1 Tax=Didymella heteroderae TaxID=1769908 RepID=A0A9P5C0A1_9PLEO|nr:hypothetical protein E8E12_000416 [Didymella heteroderae]